VKRFRRLLRYWAFVPVAAFSPTEENLLRLEELRLAAEPTVEAYVTVRYSSGGKSEWHRFHEELRVSQTVAEMAEALTESAASRMAELIEKGIPKENIGNFHLVVPNCQGGSCRLTLSMDVTPDELGAVA
jgi:hypothetical protein